MTTCECGEWSGERCQWTGPDSERVAVEFIPPHLRGTYRKVLEGAGSYPTGGAVRIRVSPECARVMRKLDGEWVKPLSDDGTPDVGLEEAMSTWNHVCDRCMAFMELDERETGELTAPCRCIDCREKRLEARGGRELWCHECIEDARRSMEEGRAA